MAQGINTSPPTRGRGLKLRGVVYTHRPTPVAPHTGAWIETVCWHSVGWGVGRVAPHTGAWIETASCALGPRQLPRCPPTRGGYCHNKVVVRMGGPYAHTP